MGEVEISAWKGSVFVFKSQKKHMNAVYLGFRKKQSSILVATQKQLYVRDQLLFKSLKYGAGLS